MDQNSRSTKELTFRDTLYNISREGKRSKIYPKKPVGKFYNTRTIVSIILLTFLFVAPFVRLNGEQLVLLNILERKFVIFGIVFWPQDFHLFALGGVTLLLSIVLFTAIYGRIWCGWLCPQTIFLEMFFRKIERMIEGDAARQRNLNRQPWTRSKIVKKASKHAIFFALSFIIANTFLAYIIGSDELLTIITDPPQEHVTGLVIIVLFSLVFYGVFARFREQACIIVCPYGRFQSAMVDENSIAVTYDFIRGEPRGKLTKEDKIAWRNADAQNATERNRGDCIDCKQCIDVCPTGIDIRNGIQLECVNCTACMDACDRIMEGVHRPTGLIRYASLNGIRQPEKHFFSRRVLVYSGLLLTLLTLLVYLFATRVALDATILRQPGTLYNELPGDRFSNFYNLKVINKTMDELPVEIRLLEPAGELTIIGELLPVGGQKVLESRFYVALPGSELKHKKNAIRFGVFANGELIDEIDSFFIGPER